MSGECETAYSRYSNLLVSGRIADSYRSTGYKVGMLCTVTGQVTVYLCISWLRSVSYSCSLVVLWSLISAVSA